MADVRSMLRAERESRRITHPHASYTSTGNLVCNLCEVPVKSDKAWSAHLHSTQHSLRSGRQDEAAEVRPSGGSKKRKAVEFEEQVVTERKKVKPSELQANKYPTPEDDDEAGPQAGDASLDTHPADHEQPIATEETAAISSENEAADLDALERDLAAFEQETIAEDRRTTISALTSAATISASAVAADEETPEGGDSSTRKSKREIENENDREDAARALEDEFDQMDQLQERVKKLRDRREALRKGTTLLDSHSAAAKPVPQDAEQAQDDHDDGNDEDDDSTYDDWTFGSR